MKKVIVTLSVLIVVAFVAVPVFVGALADSGEWDRPANPRSIGGLGAAKKLLNRQPGRFYGIPATEKVARVSSSGAKKLLNRQPLRFYGIPATEKVARAGSGGAKKLLNRQPLRFYGIPATEKVARAGFRGTEKTLNGQPLRFYGIPATEEIARYPAGWAG